MFQTLSFKTPSKFYFYFLAPILFNLSLYSFNHLNLQLQKNIIKTIHVKFVQNVTLRH